MIKRVACRLGLSGLTGVMALMGLLAGCSTMQYPINEPLKAEPVAATYGMSNMFKRPGDEELVVVVTFSGGGTRAAALAFGVIEELANQRIRWKGHTRRLIDEVDLVYGVSGGAIPAMYWSLRGDAMLEEFPERFLEKDLQSLLSNELKSFANLWRLGSPRYGRGELLAAELNRTLFHGATFADLVSHRQGPFGIISAADLSSGTRFDFLQDYFDLLCSDLSSFPIARAVAASAAVPVLFAPITLWNHGKDCPRPRATLTAAQLPETHDMQHTREQVRMTDLAEYLDVSKRPYVHLVDGGIADNLALRSLLELEGLARVTGQAQLTHWVSHVKEVLFVVVDAGTLPSSHIERNADVPRLSEVMTALADIPVHRFSDETRQLFRQTVENWRLRSLSAGRDPSDLPIHVAEVSLRGVKEAPKRKNLISMPTTLYLPKAQVELLRRTGAEQLRQSPDFVRFMSKYGTPEPQ